MKQKKLDKRISRVLHKKSMDRFWLFFISEQAQANIILRLVSPFFTLCRFGFQNIAAF
jgi:hypothetical protein